MTHFVSRDLDSRLNAREAAAVGAWLDSSKAFHFMRDNPAHAIEILGSGWGVRMRSVERSMMVRAFEAASKDKMFWAPRAAYGPDQGFLKRYGFTKLLLYPYTALKYILKVHLALGQMVGVEPRQLHVHAVSPHVRLPHASPDREEQLRGGRRGGERHHEEAVSRQV